MQVQNLKTSKISTIINSFTMSEMQFEFQDSLPQITSYMTSNQENTKLVPGFSTMSYCSYPEQEDGLDRYSREVCPRQISEELFQDQFGFFGIVNDVIPSPEKEDTGLQQVLSKNVDKQAKKIQKEKKDTCKNSNTIKKYGRLILDYLKKFQRPGKANVGVDNMMRLLNRKSRKGRNEVNKRDKFNTFHLKAMLESGDFEETAYNLMTTRNILNKHLRHNVLESSQIDDKSKLVYMNTLKTSSLRCSNKHLAVRLQIANDRERVSIAQ